MIRIAVHLGKGGPGKSTLSWALASFLSTQKTVLAIDLDPQGTLTNALIDQQLQLGTFDVLMRAASVQDATMTAPKSYANQLRILAASSTLATLEQQTASDLDRHYRLSDALNEAQGFEVVIMDTPPGSRLEEIEERLLRTDGSKKAVERIEGRIVEFKAGWKKGSVSQKKRLIRALIENIEVRPGALGLFYLVHDEDPTSFSEASVHRPTFRPKKEMAGAADFQTDEASGSFVIPAVGFDVDVKNGVPNPTTTSKLKPHCLLQLSVLEKPCLLQKIADLYRSGHSIHEIAKQLRKSRDRVRAHLEKAKLLLPVPARESITASNVLRGKVRWNSPYGFKYEQGRGIKHPQEFETLLILFKQRDAGLNAREIADKLNEQKLRPRSARRWDRCTVHRIIEWHDKHPNFLQEVLSWTSNNSSK